ncbi:hypothetical protein HDU96_009681 [Phlyctochytrium bullatum]|nr:hypothetical protein HDU96_009681 [Phlyctochytrium bullatum]
MSSIFNRFPKFRKAGRSNSTPNLSISATTSASSSSAPLPTSPASAKSPAPKKLSAEQAAVQQAEVVIMVNGEAGPRAIVPLISTSRAALLPKEMSSPSPAAPPAGARLPITPVSPALPSASAATPKKASVPAQALIPSTTVHLLDLPNELLTTIAMRAGFFAATTLMLTNKRFYSLLNNPASWTDYTRGGSSDVIESEVTICTKIHTFDHLVFGLWHDVTADHTQSLDQDAAPILPPPTSSRRAMTRSLSSPSVLCKPEPHIYFEHMTFNEQYDFLGGISLGMTPGGLISSEFFDHRETLPCYREALAEAVAQGVLPPSAPHGTPPPGSKIDHSCPRCARYDGREVLKSLFVFDQVPYHPKWGREGFSWMYAYPDGRRKLKVSIKPFQGALGYTSVSDLPSLFINCITVDGRSLSKGGLYDLFNRLVNGKEKRTVV